jgi:hypothetical protein
MLTIDTVQFQIASFGWEFAWCKEGELVEMGKRGMGESLVERRVEESWREA